MEGLRLVETLTVKRANLVGMSVGFCSPTSAIPKLTVRRITTGKLAAGHVLYLVHPALIKLLESIAITPVRAIVSHEGALVTVTEGCVRVINRMEIHGRGHHGALAIAARCSVQLLVGHP